MKTLNIIGASLSTILIGLSFYYIDEVYFLKWRDSFNYDGYSSASYADEALTTEVGIITLFFFFVLGFIFIKNIKQSKKAKTISIIGIILTLILIAWDGLMLSSPSHISFDEVGYAWMGYGAICILFFVLLLKRPKATKEESKDVIDDIEFE